jgi:uncharacterized LabA/DUF88 family protein
MTDAVAPTTVPLRVRVHVFIDFWNFSLSLRSVDGGFMINWSPIGPLLAKEAARLVDPIAQASFEGLHVYGSYDPGKANDLKLKKWFTNTLDKMPGTHAVLLERQRRKGYPRCPACRAETTKCHACDADMRGTEEKGVDTRIVTDMIALAWSSAYDLAVIVSSDRDFVPVAEFLQARGIKVIHGAFPPSGSHLTQKCWGSIRIPDLMDRFRK